MKYNEIEEILKESGQNSAIEQLRAAVGEEALDLKRGVKGDLDEATAVEQAREFFAEDISRWINDGGGPDPQTLINLRARYAKSWAFAQIVHNLLRNEVDDLDVPSVDPDTIVRVCLANAELGSKLVELIGTAQQAARAAEYRFALETLSKLLDSIKAPEMAMPHGHRKLAIWERFEEVIGELETLRENQPVDIPPEIEHLAKLHEGEIETAFEEMRNVATVAQDNAKKCLELLKKSARNLCWAAQTIHEVHANGEKGRWRDCSKGVCGSMEHMLAAIGFDKDLNDVPVIP